MLEAGLKYREEDREEFQENMELLAELMMIKAEHEKESGPYGDMFGEYMLENYQLNPRAGQFFTPMNVCDMMVAMTISEESMKKTERMLDPAGGTGRFMLRTAKYYAEKIGTYNFIFTNIDIDFRVYVFCTMNAILHAIPSINVWGDSLALEFREGFVTIGIGAPVAMWGRLDVESFQESMRQSMIEQAKERQKKGTLYEFFGE